MTDGGDSAAAYGALQSMFVHAPPELLAEVLRACGGDVEAAVDRLLGGGAPPPSCPPEADMDVAPLVPVPAACYHHYCTAEYDASGIYAADPAPPPDSYLQDWVCLPETGSGCATSSGLALPQAPPAPTNLTLTALLRTTPDFEATFAEVKRTLLPLVCDHLGQLRFPPITQEFPVGDWGLLSFGTGDLAMAALRARPEDLHVDLRAEELRAVLRGVAGEAQPFTWWYQKTRFPRLKDRGHATVSFSEVGIRCAFNVCFASARPVLRVHEAEVTVGQLRVRVGGTWKSWLYSLLLRGWNATLRGVIEQALSQALRNAGGAMEASPLPPLVSQSSSNVPLV